MEGRTAAATTWGARRLTRVAIRFHIVKKVQESKFRTKLAKKSDGVHLLHLPNRDDNLQPLTPTPQTHPLAHLENSTH